MFYSIAVYPHKGDDDEREKRIAYLERAARQGFGEVFLSLHLPEFSLEEQLSLLEELSCEAKRRGMCLTVDVGGGQLAALLADEKYCERICAAAVDFIRLDYGFSPEQIQRIWEKWNVRGFVVNASMYDRAECAALQKRFEEISPQIELRACHNYYPRPESGLSYDFFIRQNMIFRELGIPVYSCIPDREHARGPLHAGLPTVEEHRNMALKQVVQQLAACPGNEGLLAADEDFSEEKLRQIRCAAKAQRRCMEQAPLLETLRIRWADGVSEEEKRIVCGQTHHIRYDSNECVLRSRSSREMSEYAGRIAPRPAKIRCPGTVTVDNAGYGRYSGELQVTLTQLPADDRVNAAGEINSQDLWKLALYRAGVAFRFIEESGDEESES